jgi:C1A family cysteine protease
MPTKKLPRIQTKGYGWKPDLPDARDHNYKMVKPRAALRNVDFRKTHIMPAVFDQGNLGSCTGNGISFALTFLALNHVTQKKPRIEMPFSRLFIYYNERVIEGTVNEDSGAYIRDGIKSVNKVGCCSEKTWPYAVSKFTKKPPSPAFKSALNYQALEYQRIDNTNKNEIVDALTQGFPVVHGFTVYDSFESLSVEKTGIVPMPDLNREEVLGGHCTVIVGYYLESDRFACANSWGTGWGQSGYYTIPAAYLTNPNLADDFWTIRLLK